MSTAAAIHAWLKAEGPYQEGLELLIAHGVDDTTLFLLSMGETSVSRAQLTEELQLVHHAHVQRTLERQDRSTSREVITKADIVAEGELLARDPRSDGYEGRTLTPELQVVRDQAKDDFKEMAFLHARLETLSSDDDRLRDALRIVQLDEAIVKAYSRLDAWQETGRDPGPGPAPSVKNGSQLQVELRNLESYLSRARSGKRPASEAKVQQWEARMAEIHKELDAANA